MRGFRVLLSRLLAVAAVALAGCYTTVDQVYFEPSGGGAQIANHPAEAPPNTAMLTLKPGASLVIRSAVVREVAQAEVELGLDPGTEIRFAGRRAVVSAGAQRAEVDIAWQVLVPDGKRFRAEPRPFDAPLTATIPPHYTGERRARYREFIRCTIPLPAAFQAAPRYTLELPAPEGGAPIRLDFERKHARYRFINTQPVQ